MVFKTNAGCTMTGPEVICSATAGDLTIRHSRTTFRTTRDDPMTCRSVTPLSFVRTVCRAILLVATPVLLGAQAPIPSPRSSSLSGDELAKARPGRDPRQPIDTLYTRKIKEYTTQPYFLSPLVD